MLKTKYAVEQHKGWWYALKCKTLFGITIWTEYISEFGITTFSTRDNLISILFNSEEAAKCAIKRYKERIKKEEDANSQYSKKRWVE